MEAWYPPGHGDFYQSFSNSGLLDEFVAQVTTKQDHSSHQIFEFNTYSVNMLKF